MKGLFFIKGVSAWINPLQVSSVYKAGESWHVAMANGSDYTLVEDEYVGLLEACRKPEPPKPMDETFKQRMDEMKKFIEEHQNL